MKNLSSKKTYLRQLIHYRLNLTSRQVCSVNRYVFLYPAPKSQSMKMEDDHIKLKDLLICELFKKKTNHPLSE